jgi:hypothetical protein
MTDDNMPPLPEEHPLWQAIFRWEDKLEGASAEADAVDAEVHAYARAYAAEQVRELVGELERINEWCCYATEEDISARLLALQQIGQAVRALIAKHKGAP